MTVGLMLHVDLRGRRVVIVGAGRAGAEKLDRLVASGADLTVVDPAAAPDLERAGLTVRRRPFTDADVAGAWLVIAATKDERVNGDVERAARAAGALVTRGDRADGGGVAFVATVERGPITVGVSTGGASPALARLLRDRISASLSTAVVELAALLAERPRANGRRVHAALALDDALAALEAGETERARALLDLNQTSAG